MKLRERAMIAISSSMRAERPGIAPG